MRELGVEPWRFTAADYLEAIASAVARPHPLTGTEVLASWDETLTATMHSKHIAIVEEAVAKVLLYDLDASSI